MDYPLTFALLLYFNVFYFGVFVSVEFFLLMFKAYNMVHKYNSTVLINEIFILTFLVVIESIRLMLGQQHTKVSEECVVNANDDDDDAVPFQDDFDHKLGAVFRILVLTVPSMYAVAYFTMWQAFVSRLDVMLGSVMLLIQACQLISSFMVLLPRVAAQFRAVGAAAADKRRQ